MRRILFSIHDLKCSYDSGKIVDIDRLDIYDGQITLLSANPGQERVRYLRPWALWMILSAPCTPEQVVFHDAGSNDKTDLASLWLKPLDMHSAFQNKIIALFSRKTTCWNISTPVRISNSHITVRKGQVRGNEKKFNKHLKEFISPPDIFNRNIRLLSADSVKGYPS